MVGVAGRSQGCNTCRRRHVKCDDQRPQCQRCVQSKRHCEGYGRFPVFINRTPAGVQRRRHLDEAKPPVSVDRLKEIIAIGHRWRDTVRPQPPLLPTPSSNEPMDNQYISCFWEESSFCKSWTPPKSPTRLVDVGPTWLYHILLIISPTPLLHKTLLAVAVTRFGQAHQNISLMNRGRILYGEALKLLQAVLDDKSALCKDETLGAVCLMVIYELCAPHTSNSWSDHISGLSRLIEYRGPISHQEAFPRALLEHSRYLLMIRSIMQQKSPPFARQVWRREPWTQTTKTLEQRIYDEGFILGSLLEECDHCLMRNDNLEASRALLRKAYELNYRLEILEGELAISQAEAPSIGSKMLDVTVLGLREGTNTIIRPLLRRVSKTPILTNILTHRTSPSHQNQASTTSPPRQDTNLALRIIQSSNACFEANGGFYAATKCALPLQLVRWSSATSCLADDIELEAARKQIVARLAQIKGMHFVTALEADDSSIPLFIRAGR